MAESPPPAADGGLSHWDGGQPEPEPEPQQRTVGNAAEATRPLTPDPSLGKPDHLVTEDGILLEHRLLVEWASPRLSQSMLQSGVEAEELIQKDQETYLKQAIYRGEQLGWKSQKAVRQIAGKRYKHGEEQRRKLLRMVLDMRQGLIDSKAELSALVKPSKKKVSIEDDQRMAAQLQEEADRRRRMMISEEQRAAASNERLDGQMALKLAQEKDSLEVEKKFEQLRVKRAHEFHEKQQAMMLWQVELEKQRAIKQEEEYAKAAAFEVQRQKKDEELSKLLKARRKQAADKGMQFSKKQQAKVDKIQAQWKEKEARMWAMKVETEKKLLESEKMRDLKRKKEADGRARRAARKSEELTRRLHQKREQDEQDRLNFIKQSEQKHASVDATLAAKKAKKAEEIKEQREHTRRKEEERRKLAAERAAQEEERLAAIVKAREEKNKLFDRMCEANEERNVIKVEQHAIKFEETVANVKRQQKADEFRQAQLKFEQQQKIERAQLLETRKMEMAAKRRYAAQQFLIEQERMREQLATNALHKSMEMANLSMDNVTKRLSLGDMAENLQKLTTPLPRGRGRLEPMERKPGASKAGRDSPLPVWTWQVGGGGGPQPKFVS